MEFKYRVSVIVPVYNQENFLGRCVDSLLKQTIPSADMEVVLVDDGSTDASPAMCDAYAAQHENILVVHKENGGLSDARNCGIEHAEGKYLMYLDSDDYLLPDTVLPTIDFFDEHYDEVDLVHYPSITMKNGEQAKPHYRYKVLDETGIYDLTEQKNIYAGITRIEVCVKNVPGQNVMFSSVRDFRQEDQKYCTDVILGKLKIGFCKQGGYVYEQLPEGLQQSFFYAYYIYEHATAFWEEEFARYDGEAPKYLQAMFANDYAWKLHCNILFPHHYSEDEYRIAVDRLDSLLSRVDPDVIIGHPAIDDFHGAYMLSRRKQRDLNAFAGPGNVALVAGETAAYVRRALEIVLLKSKLRHDGLTLIGQLKSPIFSFVGVPKVIAVVTTGKKVQEFELPLRSSSWDYYRTKIKTNKFYNFTFKLSNVKNATVRFLVEINGHRIKTTFYFMGRAIFSNKAPKRQRFIFENCQYYHKRGSIGVKKLTPAEANKAIKQLNKDIASDWQQRRFRDRVANAKRRGKRIWLYHDCHGVEKNNAYDQFMHDLQKNDGIERFYVVNDDLSLVRHLFNDEQWKRVIRFQSGKHKHLFLCAERIITAYVERVNFNPYTLQEMKAYQDLFTADIVYLQHGVLHAHTPWKYSLDRLHLDKEVISTPYEAQNLVTNYAFTEDALIKAGMPRYDFIDPDAKPKRKILFAPSWRKYLIRQNSTGQWDPVYELFEQSDFFKGVRSFLNSPDLHALLEQYDYTLEFKLHPIFAEFYLKLLHFDSDRVSVAQATVRETDYAVFISDFSSYRFDFVYLKRAIMYFMPDRVQFEAGMCDYRETDLPLGGMFGKMTHTADEAIAELRRILEQGGVPEETYREQMEGFFYHYDNNQRERIYSALVE